MRLRKHAAALALCCATAAFAQPTDDKAPDKPREVQVKERPAEQRARTGDPIQPGDVAARQPPQSEEQRVVELYKAQLGGQLTNATYLGVSTSAVPAALRQHLGLPEGVGLVVDFVEDDSPAKTAGVKQYDILKKVDDQILVNGQQLAVLIRSRKAGDEAKLTIIRGGKEQALAAKLVERPGKPLEDMFLFDFNQPNANWAQRSIVVPRAQPQRQNRNRNGSGSRTMSVWRDNDTTITISQGEGQGRHLTVADKSGKTIFEGNLDNKEERAKLPPDIAEKLKQMESKLPPSNGRPPGGDLRGSIDFGAGDFEVKFDGSVDFNGEQEVEVEQRKEENSDDESTPSVKRPIRDNDVLNIAIAGVHGPGVRTTKLARVRGGQVQLPYVAPVKCIGLTENELEKKVTALYTEAKIAPNVAVRVRNVGAMDQRASKDEAPVKP